MLTIKNLSASFGSLHVLRGINLEIRQGEVLALIGESGTGKTTLGRAVMGLTEARLEGEIFLDGEEILTKPSPELRKIRWHKIAMVFQNVEQAFNPLLPVIDQVMEPLISHQGLSRKEALAKAAQWLMKVGLDQQLHKRYPHQLSGGQKQRALIAMALILDPQVLILDEPTSALDPLGRQEMIELLQKLGKGRTMLLITHDFASAAQLADRVAVLYGGKLVEDGPVTQIMDAPKHPYTRGLIRSYPNMTTTKELQGIPGRLEWTDRGCPFASRCTQAEDICFKECPELPQEGSHRVACHLGGIIPLIYAEDLSHDYDGVKTLDGIRLLLREGETVALVGESGSGKTTLAKCLMGLEPYQGKVWFRQRLLEKRDKGFFRQVQMVFQSPNASLSHRMTVLEAVGEPLEIQGMGKPVDNRERIQEVLREVHLPWDEQFLAEHVHHLSGGEAQRVAIARALILNPRLLIADEPTSALDPSVQAKIIKLLLNIQENRGLGILFITHDFALARKVSDRVIVLKEGRVVEEGLSHQISACPKHPYTKKLLQAAAGWHDEEPEYRLKAI